MRGRLRFDRIAATVEETLNRAEIGEGGDIESLLDADVQARRLAKEIIANFDSPRT